MSGIYIPGMEMPKNCAWCRFLQSTDPIPKRELFCGLDTTNNIHDYMPYKDCPLVPVPDHGRLVDSDAFIKRMTDQICKNCDRRRGMKDGKLTKRFVYPIGGAPCRACGVGDMLDYIDDAPTVIPADKEETE